MPEDKWICQRCDAVNIANSKYCRNCKKVLAIVKVEKTPEPGTNWYKVFTWLLGLSLFVLFVFYIDQCGVMKMSPEKQEDYLRELQNKP